MNDGLRDAGYAVLGLALLSWILTDRVSHAARRELKTAFPTAHFDICVTPRGLLGMTVGQAYKAKISGGGFSAEKLPFRIEPGGGTVAGIRHLELDLHDIVLRDLGVQTLKADIPFVKADAGRVLFDGHLRFRGAGEGTGTAVLSEGQIERFLAKKRPQFQDLKVKLTSGEALISGKVNVLLPGTPFEAKTSVGIQDGRYLNAVNATVKLGDKPVLPSLALQMQQIVNPIIDVDKDLGLGEWLYITSAEIGEGILTVRGRVHIPAKH